MSATTQFTTFSDLYLGLLKAIRSDSSNSATVEQAKRYINTALADMHVGFAEKVPWALRDYSFATETTFTTTVNSTYNPAGPSPNPNSITYLGSIFANGDGDQFTVGQKLVITNSDTAFNQDREFEVRTTTATTPATVDILDPEQSSTTMTVGDTVRVYQDDIELPDDFMKLAGNIVKLGSRDIPVIGRVEFRHRFAGDFTINRPQYSTMIDSHDTVTGLDNRKLRLFPIPNNVERGKLTYVTKNLVVAADGTWQQEFSADTDEPIIPRRYRHALYFHALYNWYRDRKDDVRSQEAKAEYVQIMNRVTNDTESGQSTMSLRSNVRQYRRKSGRPYNSRSGGRRYDFGRFDRLE